MLKVFLTMIELRKSIEQAFIDNEMLWRGVGGKLFQTTDDEEFEIPMDAILTALLHALPDEVIDTQKHSTEDIYFSNEMLNKVKSIINQARNDT